MATYHLELRSFPRSTLRFNQTGEQIGAIVIPWVQEQIVELDEEKWAPYDSTITIVEGPPIPVERLSMGRGWPTAKREGTDVTERVLAEARQALADGTLTSSSPAAGGHAGAPPSGPPLAATGPGTVRAATDYPSRAAEAATPAEPAPESPAQRPAPSAGERGELSALLGSDAPRLLAAWRGVSARASGLTPSESLALAERELREG